MFLTIPLGRFRNGQFLLGQQVLGTEWVLPIKLRHGRRRRGIGASAAGRADVKERPLRDALAKKPRHTWYLRDGSGQRSGKVAHLTFYRLRLHILPSIPEVPSPQQADSVSSSGLGLCVLLWTAVVCCLPRLLRGNSVTLPLWGVTMAPGPNHQTDTLSWTSAWWIRETSTSQNATRLR